MLQSTADSPTFCISCSIAVIDKDLLLRGILKYHCGNHLTGAPSREKSGKYFHYYKCKVSKHNNISATKAHKQLMEIWELMSLPEKIIFEIKMSTSKAIEENLKESKRKIIEKKQILEETQEKIFSVEEKWIKTKFQRIP